jgi:hypothetical protein
MTRSRGFNVNGVSMFALMSAPAASNVAYVGTSCFDLFTILIGVMFLCVMNYV